MIRVAAVVVALMAMVSSSYAYERHHYRYAPRQHHHRSVVPWVAGGLALGALGAGAYAYRRQYYEGCVERFMGYDYYGRRVYQTFCPDY